MVSLKTAADSSLWAQQGGRAAARQAGGGKAAAKGAAPPALPVQGTGSRWATRQRR